MSGFAFHTRWRCNSSASIGVGRNGMRPLRAHMASLKGIKRRFANDNEECNRRSVSILQAIQELRAGADQMDLEIRKLAHPKCRQWEIRRIDSRNKMNNLK